MQCCNCQRFTQTVCDVTVIEWRSDKNRVGRARKILDSPDFREMLEVLQKTNPVYYPLPKNASDGDRSAQLGRIEGACFFVESLKSLGELYIPTNEPEMKYA